jgi:uncharacterized integral membrane protein
MTTMPDVPPPDPDGQATKRRRNQDLSRLVAAAVIVGLLVAFVIDNSHSTKVGFVFFSKTVPLIWVLLVTAVLGMFADRLLVWWRRQHRRTTGRGKANKQK